MSARPESIYPDSFWRSLRHLNAFRFFLAVFFLLSVFLSDQLSWLRAVNLAGFFMLSLFYGLSTGFFGWMLKRRQPGFERMLALSLWTDIVCLIVLMHLGGGGSTGLGLLLMVFMAAAGLHAQSKMMLLVPSGATLGLLLEQALQAWLGNGGAQGFIQVSMLAVALFMVAALSHVMARSALSATTRADIKEREVANLEMINARVIQDLPYGVVVVDGEGRLIQHNIQAQVWMGCTFSHNIELGICAPELFRRFQAWKKDEVWAEPVIQGMQGKFFRVRMMELDPSRQRGAVIMLEDLTELEQEAHKLKLAALGRLTANLAHEIRNPLSAINHAAQLLSEDVGAASPQGRLTRIIEDNVIRLNRMVEDVLLLNRRDRLVRERIDLEPMLQEFVTQYRASEAIPDGVVAVQVEPELTVMFDRTHLHQILWNLSRNAWRHCSQTRGSIRFSTYRQDRSVLVEVYNDGAPIAKALQARLFEPFYTTDSRGTGLGLYIARELAQANEADLSCVDTEAGAMFRLTCTEAVPT